jgi:hypothetical protein
MYLQVNFEPSHRCIERELESSAKTKASTPLHNSSFVVAPTVSLQDLSTGAEHTRVAHRTVYRTCPVHHRTSRQAHTSALQRSEPNGLVTWLAHRTIRWRTGLSGAPCDSSLHQTASLVVGAINTPTTPTFKSSKFSNFQPLTRALAFNSRHTQVIKSSHNSTKALVLSERDLLCSFELLCLDCFLSHPFLRSNSLVIEARDTNRVVILVGTLCSK